MVRRPAAAVLMTLTIAVPTASAAEPAATPMAAAAAVSTAAASASTELAADTNWSLTPVRMGASPETRGALLPTLYASLAALNVYDIVSTHAGISHGVAESNPAMHGIAGNTTSMIAVKTVTTAGAVLAAERLWKNHHKTEAIAMMVLSNGIMSGVALHNNSVLHSVR